MIIVHRSPNLIERDALLAHLHFHNIAATTGRRDVIQNPTDNPNLALGGYSALFEGYEIFAPEDRADEAKALIQSYLADVQSSENEETDKFSLTKKLERRLIVLALLSLALPVLPQIIFIYLFVDARKKNLKPTPSRWIPAVLLLILGGIVSFGLIAQNLGTF